MKLLEKPIKVSYINPIQEHYDTYTIQPKPEDNSGKYENIS